MSTARLWAVWHHASEFDTRAGVGRSPSYARGWPALPPQHGQARANDVIRSLTGERRLNAGIDRQRTGQTVDDADVDGELLAAVALGARVEDEFEEPQQRRREIARQRGRRDALGEIPIRAVLADRRRAQVDLELEVERKLEAAEDERAEIGPAAAEWLVRRRQAHEHLHRQMRRPRLVLDAFEEAIPNTDGDVAGPRVVLGAPDADERLPAEIQLDVVSDADPQIPLDLESSLRSDVGPALARQRHARLQLHGAARDELCALGDFGTVGVDLSGGYGSRADADEQECDHDHERRHRHPRYYLSRRSRTSRA